MAHRTKLLPIAWACMACAPSLSHAQTAPDTALPRVTVTAPAAANTAGITSFGDRALDTLPLQATVIDREQIDASGARRLADLLKLDASTTDAYNSPGYWDFIAVRGYAIDQRFNYRREGLPISAETAIPLENKERIEVLKGTSGIQAGTSAPGGIVNYVVKRPTAAPLRSVTLSTGERGSLGLAVDLSDRAGPQRQFGWRLNATSEDRRPQIDDYGHLRRSLLALAGDWQVDAGSLLQVEVEASKQTGASLPGYSLLGDALPAPRKPFNLNNQPWSLPNQFEGLTGSLRYERALGSGWRWTSQAGAQRLRTDDRLAYAFGFDCHPTSSFTYCDRYAPNGDFDLYDFRSEDERRRVDALETALQGSLQTGALKHDLRVGIQASRQRIDVHAQAFNYINAGPGNIDGTRVLPANPTPDVAGTNRKERSTEFFASDAIGWGGGWTTWLGLRHTRLQRKSVLTDGTEATAYGQGFTTPWVAASYEFRQSSPARHTVYASWGQGAESSVVPNLPRYDNRTQVLPVLKSRQWEFGLKGRTASATASRASWSITWFDIDRPFPNDAGPTYFIDGSARHRGIEASTLVDSGPWSLGASGMWLDAKRRGAQDSSTDGQRPVNVPGHTLRLQGRYRVAAVPNLELATDLSHEGRRNVLDDGSIELPSWTRTDIGLRWLQPTSNALLTWRLGIDNVFDRQAWKESPTQFGHVYLYPLEARTLRLSVQAKL